MESANFQLSYSSPDGTKWVKNMRDLANVLGVGRDSLQRWRRIYDDFPSADAAGRYNVERFRTWMDLARADGRVVGSGDDEMLFKELGGGLSARIKIADLKYRQFRAKKAEREFRILEKKYIAASDVAEAWERAASRIFQMIVAKVSTVLVNAGLSALDANGVAENVANDVFEDLSSAEAATAESAATEQDAEADGAAKDLSDGQNSNS